jgi:hypothetical protein
MQNRLFEPPNNMPILNLNPNKKLHISIEKRIYPKFRIRKCGIAKTAVIQSIGSMD